MNMLMLFIKNTTKESMKITTKCSGFILKDYLLSLVVMLILLPIIVSSLKVVMDYQIYDERVQDELSIVQLRNKLLIGKDFKVEDDNLKYRIGQDEWQLRCEKDRLYLAPGYQLFFDNLDACAFNLNGSTIELMYQKHGVDYVWPIFKE